VAGTDLVLDSDFSNTWANVEDLLANAQDVTLGTFTESTTFGYTQGGAGVGDSTVGGTIYADNTPGGFKRLQDDVQALCAFLGQTVRVGVGTDVTSSDTITAATWSNLMLNVKDCWDNRFVPASTTLTTDATVTRVTAWNVSLSQTTTWTFASEADCRGFFNGGGGLGITASRTGGTASDQNTEWGTMLSAMGELTLKHDTTTGSSGTGAGLGFYELTTTPTQLWIKYGATVYSTNFFRLMGSVNSITNPTVVTLTAEWGDPVTPTPDTVDGTMTLNARRTQPDASGSGFSFDVPTDGTGAISGS